MEVLVHIQLHQILNQHQHQILNQHQHQILKIQQDMSGMIEEVYITYLIDFSKSAQLSTFLYTKKQG